MSTITTTKLIIKNELNELNKLVGFIEHLGQKKGLDPKLVMNLNLALEEVVTNIILYAYPKKVNEKISIKCNETNNSLVFIISDKGVKFNPAIVKKVDTTLQANERSIGGLGIFLIQQIMDEIKYERIDNKNILTIKKDLK